jgi:N-acetylglucosaminyldiphosphoundecaprenol N-acetyl-beta-D-mannosaminyltransferase
VQEFTPSIREILGVPIHGLTMDQTIDVVDTAITEKRPMLISVVNAAKIVNMWRDEELRRSVLSGDLILADGMSVVWASRLLRRGLPERVAGIDLMVRMLALADDHGYRVYCLGARDEVLAALSERIKAEYPNLKLVGTRNGYYGEDEESAVAAEISEAAPDILFVGMSSPRKERFLARWASELNVPVCHGVGGSFDVLAGKVKRAPTAWQRFGVEWLYRVIQEPRRMWRRYLVTNVLFGLMLLGELSGLKRVGTGSKA